MTTSIAAIAFGQNKDRLAIFGCGADQKMYWKYWNGHDWLPSPAAWYPLGGEKLFTDPPAVVSRGDNRLDIVARGSDKKIYSKRYDGNAWSDWEDLGGSNFSSPPAAALHDDQLVVFAIHNTQDITYTQWHDGQGWSKNWEKMKGASRDPPALVSWRQQLDVFHRSAEVGSRLIFRAQWQAGQTGPQDWVQITQQKFDGASAVVSGLDGRTDIFGLGPDKKIYHWLVDKSTSWKDLDGTFDSPPAAVSWGKNQLGIFALRNDKKIYRRRLINDDRWSDWGRLNERQFDGAPVAVSRGEGRLDIFAQGADGQVYGRYWHDNCPDLQADWTPLAKMETPPALRLRAARDWMIDLLGLGATLPLRDLPVTPHQSSVPPDSTAKIVVENSQPDVEYALSSSSGSPAPGTGKRGTGKTPLELETSPIKTDVTYTVRARKVGVSAREVNLLRQPVFLIKK